jgi:phage-related protein
MIPAGVRGTIGCAIQACIDAVTLVIKTVVNASAAIIQSIVDPIAPVVEALFNSVTAAIKPVCDDIGLVSHNSAGDQ